MALEINHHRNARDWINDFLFGSVTVSPSPSRMKVGALEVKNRTKLMVINDATCVLYLSKEEVFTPNDGEAIVLLPGERIQFHFNPEASLLIYGKTDEVTANIRVIEVI